MTYKDLITALVAAETINRPLADRLLMHHEAEKKGEYQRGMKEAFTSLRNEIDGILEKLAEDG